MATQIGTINTLVGTVTTKTAEGTQRTLQAGDIVYQDDIIITGELGAVEVELTDGSIIDLGRNSEAALNPDSLYPEGNENADGDIIQQAILDGADPTQNAEPTAAGNNLALGGNEGTSIVSVQHLAPEITPQSGFDTTGINVALDDDIEQVGAEALQPTDDVPTVAPNATIRLDDDALANGNPGGNGDDVDSQKATGTLAHSFGANGEGTLLLSNTAAPAGFSYSLNGDGTVLIISQDGTSVLQVTLADTTSGNYTVTQLAPIDHPEGNDENNLDFNLAYQVTDSDGDTVNGQINISVDDDSPVVTVNQDVVNDVAYSFTVTNYDQDTSAGYHSSYGYYIKDDNGNPTTGTIIWDDVHAHDAESFSGVGLDASQGYSSSQGDLTGQVGFFIIPNGDNNNSSLADLTNVTFQNINGQWQAFDGANPIIGTGSHIIFDNKDLNLVDNTNHVQLTDSDMNPNNDLDINQHWEDLQIPGGDGDYNDVKMKVESTTVTLTGDSIDTDFGADGRGSIDFTLDDINISGDLTSNGKEVTFQASDADNDGYNDTLVGSTDDGDVLSIEGILDSDAELHLFAPVDSTNASTDDVQITANLSITDSDGDSAFATLNFNLDIALETPAVID